MMLVGLVGLEVGEVQGFKGLKVQGFKGSEVQRLKEGSQSIKR